jgi:hypothetical protein
VYVPAARFAEIVSVLPGLKERSLVVRLTPAPLMTSAWLIVPSLRAAMVTGVPASRVTVAGVIEYSLSESVIVDPLATGLAETEPEPDPETEAAADGGGDSPGDPLAAGRKVKPGVDPPP